MVFLPVKPLEPFEHVHERKSKWFKHCRPEFDGVLFYDMKQKYFVSDMTDFVVMDIYFFIYNLLGGEKLLFYALHDIKVSPQSTLYMKKKSIHNNELFHAHFMFATEETCKKLR